MLEAAQSLAGKLEKFGESLDPAEQEALSLVMRLYSEAVEERIDAVRALSAEDEGDLAPVRDALAKRQFDDAMQPMTTPCWTVTTVTTTVQSSKWVCTPPKK